jgi:hypothetical protein
MKLLKLHKEPSKEYSSSELKLQEYSLYEISKLNHQKLGKLTFTQLKEEGTEQIYLQVKCTEF